ncbi:MAG: LysR family transcriptional regulator [Nannocystaceae bacterium]
MSEHSQAPTLADLEAFLELAQRRSIQATARAMGRSRATYMRVLAKLERVFDAPELLQRAPGQRQGVLTPAGQELARRARVQLRAWARWNVTTRDALQRMRRSLRLGTLAGSFDLLADILVELREASPDLAVQVVEYPDDLLLDAVDAGHVDLGFGTLDPQGVPPRLSFESLGPLPWAVIVPAHWEGTLPAQVRLADLDGVPLVVTRVGPARERLEREFAQYRSGPLVLNPAFEVASTPRVVEMVARGFGPAVVSRFRLSFLPPEVEVRPLRDGPAPLMAGVFLRRDAHPTAITTELVARARRRFRALSGRTAVRS